MATTRIRRRSTFEVNKIKAAANNMLSNDLLSPDEKQGIVHLLSHILHESGNYAGFRYLDSYNSTDPEFENGGRKNLRREYS